ncbi:hypothetical protein [Nocardia pseudovaccinii]|uniref:hypothetical protein n=1 Tax=Nocardia pseudovaccinii TaxID=189540 RepID=UPI000A4929EA|nr:hypothetical protein [Nocardia pseudovaccinii]
MNRTPVVEIFHNVALDARARPAGVLVGYRHGHELVEVFVCRPAADHDAADVTDTAQRVMDFTAGIENAAQIDIALAVAFDHRTLRPVARGDLLRIDGYWLTCESHGWGTPSDEPRLIAPEELTSPSERPKTASSPDLVEVADGVVVAPAAIRSNDVLVAVGGRRLPAPVTVRDVVHRRAGFINPAEYYPFGDTWEVLPRSTFSVSRFLRERDYATVAHRAPVQQAPQRAQDGVRG